ncbi:hypothetical protein Y032_0007g3191 [Ancylostoma ceylanicum]|uniref:Uncharacterized protein n=1 Tax=Ancylostoma ceylanicum TaxID=53326 RepID=A0A016VM33_9BILA|nr:hypothetical protein Y032_0007g3191 [Ancylostoma ceylanicum]
MDDDMIHNIPPLVLVPGHQPRWLSLDWKAVKRDVTAADGPRPAAAPTDRAIRPSAAGQLSMPDVIY